MREAKLRRLAVKLQWLMQDGRPPGCTCPPNPRYGQLPCDNRHIASPRCALTRCAQALAQTEQADA